MILKVILCATNFYQKRKKNSPKNYDIILKKIKKIYVLKTKD